MKTTLEKVYVAGIILLLVFYFALMGTAIYVAWHFINKYW